jgi:hypothetical protein
MDEEPVSGRTPWDALVEVLSTWRLLFLIFGSVVVLFLVVHFSAEPGTNVEFFGVLKYQKAKPLPPVPKVPEPDETASYQLPKDVALLPNASEAIPILDGTLAVRSKNYSGAELVGDNIGKIRVGSRKTDGTPGDVYRDGQTAVLFSEGTRIEIEYRGRLFALSARSNRQSRGMLITVEPISRATLNLRLVRELGTAGD